jgi:hypothetical protein
VVLVSVGLLLLYPLIQGGERGWPAWSFGLMTGSLPVLAAFAWYQARRERTGFPWCRCRCFGGGRSPPGCW